ncbi:MAG: hypothetical protein EXQ77_05535, partial [Thermoleophilia bacterium]|nr:hypothetical protein [Thermoleophilia bacterium]
SHLLALAPRGAAVRLEADPLLETTDRYGRLLRYVLRNGMNVNLELVRRGAAAPYYYRGERGTIANELWAAVRAARAEKRGLWGACPGTPLQPERAIDTGTSGPPSSKGFSGGTCDPSYVGVCIPPPPPDLDCSDFKKQGFSRITVVGADPHRLDGDHDGVACK